MAGFRVQNLLSRGFLRSRSRSACVTPACSTCLWRNQERQFSSSWPLRPPASRGGRGIAPVLTSSSSGSPSKMREGVLLGPSFFTSRQSQVSSGLGRSTSVPRDTGLCLETRLAVTPWGGGAAGIWWAEARNAAQHPECPGRPPHNSERSSAEVAKFWSNRGVWQAPQACLWVHHPAAGGVGLSYPFSPSIKRCRASFWVLITTPSGPHSHRHGR